MAESILRREPMAALHPSIAHIPRPPRIARLPVDARGYPVPAFVCAVDGAPDHRVVDARRFAPCVNHRQCWICGERRGRFLAFLLGPMSIVSRTVSEPPSHRDCAEYSVKACPFMSRPHMSRREAGLPEEGQHADGIPILRNPGVMCLWVTRSYRPFLAEGGKSGMLFEVGEPTETVWYAEGRLATRAEVLASLGEGATSLRALLAAQAPHELAAFDQALQAAQAYVPAADDVPRRRSPLRAVFWQGYRHGNEVFHEQEREN
jgi:hypothetical protein